MTMNSSLEIPMNEVTNDQLKTRCTNSLEHIEVQIDLLRQCCSNNNFTPAPNLCFSDTYRRLRKDLKIFNVVIEELSSRGIIKPFEDRKNKKLRRS